MACFVVPAAEAIVTTAVQKIIRKKGKDHSSETALKFSEKLGVLNGLFWGGSGLLAFEHIWHGEITPFFPLLTAASDPGQTAEMLREMAVSGTSMALLVTAVWVAYVLISSKVHTNGTDTAESGADV